jgi:hypothetical protein
MLQRIMVMNHQLYSMLFPVVTWHVNAGYPGCDWAKVAASPGNALHPV